MFTGFPEETLQFFLDIRFHNSISYFEEQRERYRQDVQAPFYAFIEEMAPKLRTIDPQMELRPYKCLARIRRDTRFTKDKSPYRDHLWITFRRAGEPREQSLNYWFEFGPQTLEWGLGFWGENRPVMDRLRRQMAAQPKRIQDIIDDCRLPEHHLVKSGPEFRRMAVPENIPPLLQTWYRSKELYIARANVKYDWAFDEKLPERVWRDYRAMAPLYRLLRGIYDDVQAESSQD